MSKGTYGFTALMEAVNNDIKSNCVMNDIHEAVNESVSFLDVGKDFVGEEDVEQDMSVDEDYVSPEEDEKLEQMLSHIEPTDEDDAEEIVDDAVESLNASLESYLGF